MTIATFIGGTQDGILIDLQETPQRLVFESCGYPVAELDADSPVIIHRETYQRMDDALTGEFTGGYMWCRSEATT